MRILSSCLLLFVTAFFGLSRVPSCAQELNDAHISPSSADQPAGDPPNSRAPVVRKNVDLVLVPVTITDSLGRLVTGLSQQNFEIFDDKQPEPIRHFSSEDAPVSLGIILDLSASMKDKLERARAAINDFCRDANPQDEYFLVDFSDTPQLAVDFTSRVEEIQNALVLASAHGRTSLLDAIYLGIDEMRRARNPKRALLVISDGGDNRSRYTPHELKSLVRESDVMIYAVGTYDRNFATREEELGPGLLSDIAEATGGRAFTVDDPRYLPSVVQQIGMELRTQYVLGYSPNQSRHDGRWHKIKVRLRLPRGLPFLQVNARPGYYAPSD